MQLSERGMWFILFLSNCLTMEHLVEYHVVGLVLHWIHFGQYIVETSWSSIGDMELHWEFTPSWQNLRNEIRREMLIMQLTQSPPEDKKSSASLRGVSHTWGQEKTDTGMSATHWGRGRLNTCLQQLMVLGALSLEYLKYRVSEDDSKYFHRAKTVNSPTKLENLQTYFSMMCLILLKSTTYPQK